MSKSIAAVYVQIVTDEDGDISWLDQTDEQMGEAFEAHARTRKEQFASGDLGLVGVRIAADVEIFHGEDGIGTTDHVTLTTPGVWNIESDSGEDYFRETADNEIGYIAASLKEIGFAEIEIAKAMSSTLEIRHA